MESDLKKDDDVVDDVDDVDDEKKLLISKFFRCKNVETEWSQI